MVGHREAAPLLSALASGEVDEAEEEQRGEEVEEPVFLAEVAVGGVEEFAACISGLI